MSLLLSLNEIFDPQDEHMPQLHNRPAYLSLDFVLAWRGGGEGLAKWLVVWGEHGIEDRQKPEETL
jgi:hypothetical protein